jgi:hypothetical protein
VYDSNDVETTLAARLASAYVAGVSAVGTDHAVATESHKPVDHRIDTLLPLALGALGAAIDKTDYDALKQGVRKWAKDDPIDALLATVIGGGLAFYAIEREHNPNCQTPWDAILYVATCLSVGYDNCFPTTPAGHALASVVQTFGPQLANIAFDAPAAETDARDAEATAVNRAILARLEDIVRLLEAQRS